jgi:hypothetical protein
MSFDPNKCQSEKVQKRLASLNENPLQYLKRVARNKQKRRRREMRAKGWIS